LKERTKTDCRNTPSTTNLEEEETVDDLRNDGNASMSEQVNRPKPWGEDDYDVTTNIDYIRVVTSSFLCNVNQQTRRLRWSSG
jgi:hypothetical protein